MRLWPKGSAHHRRLLRNTFRDPAIQLRYESNGYVTVPLLDPSTVEEVRRVRGVLGPAPGDPRTGLFNDTWSTDLDYKRDVAAALGELVAPAVSSVFVDHRILGLVHIVKWPGDTGRVVAHRDPSFVDEQRYRSAAVWCALHDIHADEGPLRVVPGSHVLRSGVRVHQSQDNLYPEVDERSEELSIPIALRAGEAIIYDHRLIHLSDANRLDRERTVVAGIVVPADAQARYAVSGPTGSELIEIGADFFVENRLNDLDVDRVLATHRRLGSSPTPPPKLSLSQLERAMRRPAVGPRPA